jgi:phosphatidate cytidylyltransferase
MPKSMQQRILVAIVLLPIGLYLVWLGGYFYFGMMALILGLAAWEFSKLFEAGGYKPARLVIVIGSLALVTARFLYGEEGTPFLADTIILTAATLIAMVIHLFEYERGNDNSGLNFVITVAGVVYLGILGGHLIPLRQLPDGFWWWMTVLPAVWLADSGAYFFGSKFGKNRLSPRLSPKKSWEGYLFGIFLGTFGTAGLVMGWKALAPEISLTPMNGAIIGLVLSIVTTLGDLGVSMIKRQFSVKDSGNILPGHGGMFDRIDTWIWASVIGYYLITWLFV